MKIVAIIPARWASSRFPGKPLADIEGRPMIVRVMQQVAKCPEISEVLVATDHNSIVQAVENARGQAILTSEDHQSGTDRCYEAYTSSGLQADFILNVQGDEPYINPRQLSALCQSLTQETQLATIVKRITSAEPVHNPNVVKAVRAASGQALYFSRSAVPYLRGELPENWHQKASYWQHIGVYAYRSDLLAKITKLPVSPLEDSEKLEQLRWLEAGYTIHTTETSQSSVGIDTPEDLTEALKLYTGFYEDR
jgi:3-deoxy-manno-octulosonate cytidylyltransferase (CMP-KDO synthetase)